MELPPKLLNYWFPSQHAEMLEDFDRDGRTDGTELVFKIQFTRSLSPPIGQTVVEVSSADDKGANQPFKFSVTAVGHFADAAPDESLSSGWIAGTASVLVGAIRERLYELTCRSPNGPFLLPIIYIDERQISPAAPVMVNQQTD